MATTATPFCGSSGDKLYLQSGQFSATLKTSQSINAVEGSPSGVCSNDTPPREVPAVAAFTPTAVIF